MPVTLYCVRCNTGTLLLRVEVLDIVLLPLLGLLLFLLRLAFLAFEGLFDSSLLAILAGKLSYPVLLI